jgi:hypothetical protein
MKLQMEHFASRQGKTLFLNTDFGSVAYRIYEKFGFRSIEKGFDFMAYHATSREEFEAAYFTTAETAIQPLDWPHWPTSPAVAHKPRACPCACADATTSGGKALAMAAICRPATASNQRELAIKGKREASA